jgi:aminoglycoside phosphotransferase (APT) family kinase protein
VQSLTKRRLAAGDLPRLVSTAFGPDVSIVDATEVSDGAFNTVYRIELAPTGDEVILKAAPPADAGLLRYEADIMRTEAEFFRLAATVPHLATPALLATDLRREVIDGDYLFLSLVPGRSWWDLRESIGTADRERLRHDLGAMVARLHTVTSDRYGYLQPAAAQGATWREAFGRMLDDLLADAAEYAAPLPVPASLVADRLGAAMWLLDEVERASLVHFDLWDGNIFLDGRTGPLELSGLIDGERAFWGDPVAELTSLALFREVDSAVLAGYATVDSPMWIDAGQLTREAAGRLAMYRAYLDLIILVEAVPRGYDPVERAGLLAAATDELHRSLAALVPFGRGG